MPTLARRIVAGVIIITFRLGSTLGSSCAGLGHGVRYVGRCVGSVLTSTGWTISGHGTATTTTKIVGSSILATSYNVAVVGGFALGLMVTTGSW